MLVESALARLRAMWDRLRTTYWFLPSIMMAASVALALASLGSDANGEFPVLRDMPWIFSGGAEEARTVLSTIAGSIITVAGTTFSITIAALSLASAQFGSRLLRNFMRDTGNQFVLGTFTSTFSYCLLVLRTIRANDDLDYVPHVSVTIGVALAIFSLGVLVYFIHHVAASIQVSYVIGLVGSELDRSIDAIFPARVGQDAPFEAEALKKEGASIHAEAQGYVQSVDASRLMRVAISNNTCLTLRVRPGDYVLTGAPIAVSASALSERGSASVRKAFALGLRRTPEQDAVFAFMEVSDIALRAVSPSINDPFTAMMCVDRITAAMCNLARRELPSRIRRGQDGHVRIIASVYTYAELVEAGYGYIRQYARNNPPVLERLRERLQFLLRNVEQPAFQQAVRAELAALEA